MGTSKPQGSFVVNYRLWRSLELHNHHSALGLASLPSDASNGIAIAMERPVQPVTLIRPHAARRAARFFVEKFPGRSLYAVKANPSPDLLQILWDEGVTHYDVASIAEVQLVAETLPEAVHLLHASGEGRGSDRRGLFQPRCAHLLARHRGGAGEDRPRDRDRRRGRDRSQPAGAHPRLLRSFAS